MLVTWSLHHFTYFQWFLMKIQCEVEKHIYYSFYVSLIKNKSLLWEIIQMLLYTESKLGNGLLALD